MSSPKLAKSQIELSDEESWLREPLEKRGEPLSSPLLALWGLTLLFEIVVFLSFAEMEGREVDLPPLILKSFTVGALLLVVKMLVENFSSREFPFPILLLALLLINGAIDLLSLSFPLPLEKLSLLLVYLLILLLIPSLLLVVAYEKLELLFHRFFKFKTLQVLHHDIYTSQRDYSLALQSYRRKREREGEEEIDVYFLITTLISPEGQREENFRRVKRGLIRLIYFWYAYQFERVYLRFLLPLFAIMVSGVAFGVTLLILDSLELEFHSNVVKMVLVTLFLIVLYISMLYHINTLLNPQYYFWYMDRLFRESRIKFRGPNYRQKILLFLDRNFLITIFDEKYDRRMVLNSSSDFERFVIEGEIDLEGRNTIVNIFVSLFMVVYLTIFVTVLYESRVDTFIKGWEQKSSLLERGKSGTESDHPPGGNCTEESQTYRAGGAPHHRQRAPIYQEYPRLLPRLRAGEADTE